MKDATPRASTIEVREIQELSPKGQVLGKLDGPIPPFVTTLPFVSLSGWTLSLGAPLKRVAIRRDGNDVADGQMVPRPDVAATHASTDWARSSGFHAAVWAHDLAGDFAVDVEAEFEDGSVAELWRLVGRAAATVEEAPFCPNLGPQSPTTNGSLVGARSSDGAGPGALLVTSFGRSGSSLVMEMLGEHPEILLRRVPPFEARFVQASCARTFLLFAMIDPQATGIAKLGVNRYWDNAIIATQMAGGDKELKTRNAFTVSERLCAEFHQGVRDYLSELGRLEGKQDTRYVCEKSWIGGPQTQLRWMWPRTKEIVLVRDLRDVICSIDSFNRKRGFASFGREAFPDDGPYFAHIGQMADSIIERAEGPDEVSRVIRYEDLVGDPKRVLHGLCDWLEVDSGTATVSAMLEGVSKFASFRDHHMTSGSTNHSVGRWRKDFSDQQTALYERHLAERNRRLGYGEDTIERRAAASG
jgi:hypothetical protein